MAQKTHKTIKLTTLILVIGVLVLFGITKIQRASGDTNTTATNNKDTYLAYAAATTNYGSSDTIKLYNYGGVSVHRPVMDWTLPAGSGTITSIKLYLYKFGNLNQDGTSTVEVHELTQAFTEAGATWNKYDGSNAWATAGGDYSATIVDTAQMPADGNWVSWDLGTGATNPIAGLTWGSNFDILLKDPTEDGAPSGYTGARFVSKESASTTKPYIEITYTPSTPTITATRRIIVDEGE